MRNTLVTPNELDPLIIQYAVERGLPTFRAMNELIMIGLAYQKLMGASGTCYRHRMDPNKTGGDTCRYCGLTVKHRD